MTDRSWCDVLIIGMGLGAATIARRLLQVGASVQMIPGAGRPRFTHLDGGIIDPDLLERALGDADAAPVHAVGDVHVFRRDLLQQWAVAQLGADVTVDADFEEARIVPHDSGALTVVDANESRRIMANSVLLTEGANPKLGIAARIRQDFAPEDMIHFGRSWIVDAEVSQPASGVWRTSWGMPAWYSIVPQPQGALVSASARIENVMRSSRDGRDTLRDLLGSPLARNLGITGEPGEIGMELVPLRPDTSPTLFDAHNIGITFDANGTIDARSLNRYNVTLITAIEQAAMMVSEWPNLVEWDDVGAAMWDVFSTPRTPYHDDRETGFIEDGAGPKRGLLDRLKRR